MSISLDEPTKAAQTESNQMDWIQLRLHSNASSYISLNRIDWIQLDSFRSNRIGWIRWIELPRSKYNNLDQNEQQMIGFDWIESSRLVQMDCETDSNQLDRTAPIRIDLEGRG